MTDNSRNVPIPLPSASQVRGVKDPIQAARDNHLRRIQAIEDGYDGKIEVADKVVSDAADKWEAVYGEEEGRYPTYSSPWFYWPFMIVLAICEAPVNRLSFELFFNESPILCLAVSLLVGAVLVTLAHMSGMIARRFRYNSRFTGGALVAAVQLAVVFTLIGTLCYGVAILRQGYLAFLTRPDPSLAQMIENDQVGQAALVILHVALGIEGWIFLFINLGIVSVGILAAFFCHDPHPSYEKFDRAKKRGEAAVKVLRLKRAAAVAAEERRFAAQLQRIGA